MYILCAGDIAGVGDSNGDVEFCTPAGFLRFTVDDGNSPQAVWPSYNGCAPGF